AFAEIRREFEVPAEFSPECQMEARAVRERGPVTPPGADSARQDRRDVPFVTIDPPGTRDLDQALSIERQGDGHRVWYAIDYASVQKDLDAGRADPQFVLLQTIGQQRIEAERARGGVSLDLPTQEVVALPTGGFALTYEAPLPVERWNAQVSLMTGMAAA